MVSPYIESIQYHQYFYVFSFKNDNILFYVPRWVQTNECKKLILPYKTVRVWCILNLNQGSTLTGFSHILYSGKGLKIIHFKKHVRESTDLILVKNTTYNWDIMIKPNISIILTSLIVAGNKNNNWRFYEKTEQDWWNWMSSMKAKQP